MSRMWAAAMAITILVLPTLNTTICQALHLPKQTVPVTSILVRVHFLSNSKAMTPRISPDPDFGTGFAYFPNVRRHDDVPAWGKPVRKTARSVLDDPIHHDAKNQNFIRSCTGTSPVESVNFVVLGRQATASEFGKKGTVTDLSLYDRKESGIIRTWVTPSGFPDKIQPLFQAINLAEYVIFHVDVLDRFTGEQIIALDALKKTNGILSHTFDVDDSRLEAMIKGTVVEGYTRVEQDMIKDGMMKLPPVSRDGPPVVTVDHCFDVRGVGTVVLGKVTSGRIKQYDTLRHYPGGHDVLVKSIQMHDDPTEESASPARVGLAVKGVRPDEIGRGDVLCAEGAVDAVTSINLDFTPNKFYKGDITQNQGCLVSAGLQVKAAKFSSIDPVVLKFEKPLVCRTGETVVILKPESPTVRILGSGVL